MVCDGSSMPLVESGADETKYSFGECPAIPVHSFIKNLTKFDARMLDFAKMVRYRPIVIVDARPGRREVQCGPFIVILKK